MHDERIEKSLFLQCASLEKQLEYHLLGNHLFENAKALFFAGVYFENKESKRWIKKGTKILCKQLKEQILNDGGHFERSPMYHAIILEGILDLYQLISLAKTHNNNGINGFLEKLEKAIHQIIPKMLLWLSSLSHQDNGIPFFNDSTFNVASSSEAIYEYAAFLGFHRPIHQKPFSYLKDSGYARIENGEVLMIADIGSLGPSYIPGHGHAETLSFEMSLKGERLFVNSGISTYNVSKERLYQRGTLAHNTVAVDGENSSQVWSSFRVAKRAQVIDTYFDFNSRDITFSAAHDGYKRLKYNLIHKRGWTLLEKKLIIEDSFTGQGMPNIISSFHLHPNWQVILQNSNRITLKSSITEQIAHVYFPEGCTLKVEDYNYAIGFNNKIRGYCLRLYMSSRALPFSFQSEIGW